MTTLCFNTLPRQLALGATLWLAVCTSYAQTAANAANATTQPSAANQAEVQKALAASATQTRLPPAPAAVRTADYIVAVVNSEPITRNEVLIRTRRVLQTMAEQGAQRLPDPESLAPEVLEQLIVERTQIQHAQETGLRVDDFAVEQALENVARQNNGSVEQLQTQLQAQGISAARLRQEIRDQLLIQRLRERDLDSRVRVSDQDIDQYQAKQRSANATGPVQALNLGHILIAVPESASPAQVRELHSKAEQAVQALRGGTELAAVALRYSNAGEPVMGMRPAERYPQAFVNAVDNTPVGGLVGPLRSPAGFHILVVLDKSTAGVPSVVTQHQSRHILLRPSAQLTERQAAAQLQELRQRLERGQASFGQLAQQYSQDGSAAQGGALGWSSPGQFVPEFERVLQSLQPGEISQPVVSRFGVHLILLEDRRQVALDARQQREMLRNIVREEKLEKAYATWAQELRSLAYVEYRNADGSVRR